MPTIIILIDFYIPLLSKAAKIVFIRPDDLHHSDYHLDDLHHPDYHPDVHSAYHPDDHDHHPEDHPDYAHPDNDQIGELVFAHTTSP